MPGLYWPASPPSLNSCIRLLRNFAFVISQNFHKIFNFVFANISLNFAKIKFILSTFCVSRNVDKIIFFSSRNSRKISRKTKLKISCKFCEIMKTKILQQPYSYTICCLLLVLTLPFRLLEDSSIL